jgi:uridine kinase
MNDTDLINRIKEQEKPVIIGTSGFGGSGKSTLTRRLSEQLTAPVVGVDSFFRSIHETDYHDWEIIDFERLYTAVILPFIHHQNPIAFTEMDWGTGEITRQTEIQHNGVLIIEGIGLFREPLLGRLDIKIWIDCPIEVAVERGKARDKNEYGVDNDHLWDTLWKQNDLQYFASKKPHEAADYVIPYAEKRPRV